MSDEAQSEPVNENLAHITGSESQTVNDLIDSINTLIGTVCAKKAALNVMLSFTVVQFRFDLEGC